MQKKEKEKKVEHECEFKDKTLLNIKKTINMYGKEKNRR
jgi:hypothetical protein